MSIRYFGKERAPSLMQKRVRRHLLRAVSGLPKQSDNSEALFDESDPRIRAAHVIEQMLEAGKTGGEPAMKAKFREMYPDPDPSEDRRASTSSQADSPER